MINIDNTLICEQIMPVLALRGFVMFPNIMLHFDIGRKKSIGAAQAAMNANQLIFLVAQKDIKDENLTAQKIYNFGVIAKVKQILKQPGGVMRVLVEGECRAKAIEYIEEKKYIKAKVIKCEDVLCEKTPQNTALVRKAQKLFMEYLSLSARIPGDIIANFSSIFDAGKLADYISSNIFLNFEEKQEILEELDSAKRLEKVMFFLSRENDILDCENEIDLKIKDAVDKNQREYFLREQIRVISQELGDELDPISEAEEYKQKLLKLKLPKDVFKKLEKECENLARAPAGSSEANIVTSYLDTCLSLPWNKTTKDKLDIKKAQKNLDDDHFGLEDVKERITELFAVRKLAPDVKGQIICLVGPPGVGKTSIAKSLARAMGRKYIRISLGGVNDESEIRGHRRTYIGSMPGRIIAALKQAGTKNPLILLDEIDKLSKDYHGDPSAALLEVLDPEQNKEFHDHYIEVPFDLSEVLFITTANDKHQIPPPLYDRMEIIELYSYTHDEKFNIAKNYLVPKQLKKHGLSRKTFVVNDEVIKILIDGYTKEAGVRELERKIAALMRKSTKIIVSNESSSVKINKNTLKDMLGPAKYKKQKMEKNSTVGLVKGLAWTPVGGETLPIEVILMKGKGKVQVTGSLGDVMKESAQIAVSYIRSNSAKLGINEDFYKKLDIHIHAPEGAVPKDGPSAGVTMTTAIVSALSETPVNPEVAMTGEVTLKGRVLAIGGLKEKTMAAYRDGIKTVIIPSENESDLQKVNKAVKNSINFIMADDLDTVLEHALQKKDKKIKSGSKNEKGAGSRVRKTSSAQLPAVH